MIGAEDSPLKAKFEDDREQTMNFSTEELIPPLELGGDATPENMRASESLLKAFI